jgi:hypothetical protein
MKQRTRPYCSCGQKAITWDDQGNGLCWDCALEHAAALLHCGMPVTLKTPGKPDMVIMPRSRYRCMN